MQRRGLLRTIAAATLAPLIGAGRARAESMLAPQEPGFARVRPGDPAWPPEAAWDALDRAVGGRLIKLASPLEPCRADPGSDACAAVFRDLRNPYAIGDNPALTQTSGWVDAWTSTPSAYAVRARNASDIVAAVNFARENRLRLVIKGGGHSYQGTSNAPDSLLVWTRDMNSITLHDAFVASGCDGAQAHQPAVSIGSGARWLAVYEAVTTRGGRYVQGGGCTTVGVAGLVHGGGFGSFSKRYGLAAAALLEAEIVTADGDLLVANACSHPDLFWAIKGGGGGSFGVLTRLTLRTRDLPATLGAVSAGIKATSDTAYRDLVARAVDFYATSLFNPHWGEQIAFGPDNTVSIFMLFQGLDQAAAEAVWAPFMAGIAAPGDFTIETPLTALAVPARRFWDAESLLANAPDLVIRDDRPGAPPGDIFYAGDAGQVGFFLHAYKSAWLPAALLEPAGRPSLSDAIFAASRHWRVALHFNKGLAGAPAEEIEAARDTAMNPAVLDAFALAIVAGAEAPAFPGLPGRAPDLDGARANAGAIARATEELLKVAPEAGSYLAESDFFDADWKRSYWGANFARLAEVKHRYDPEGLFFTHNGVGSDEWSPDGFNRL